MAKENASTERIIETVKEITRSEGDICVKNARQLVSEMTADTNNATEPVKISRLPGSLLEEKED